MCALIILSQALCAAIEVTLTTHVHNLVFLD